MTGTGPTTADRVTIHHTNPETTVDNTSDSDVSVDHWVRMAERVAPELSRQTFWTGEAPSVRHRLKLFAMRMVARIGGAVGKIVGRRATGTFGVLTYHRIAKPTVGAPTPTINVHPQRFRDQLVGLLRRGFRFERLSRIQAAVDSGTPLPERTVAVTFDDIFDCVYHQAWPILHQLRIPSTMFVSTQYIDTINPFPFDTWGREHRERVSPKSWRPIRDLHLREMLSSGLIEIGAHTHSHQDFRANPAALEADCVHSLDILSERYDVEKPAFAFPYGSPRLGFCSPAMTDAVRRCGVRCALTTDSRTNPFSSNPFNWGRFHVFAEDTATSLKAKLDGWYEWAPQIKRRLMG